MVSNNEIKTKIQKTLGKQVKTNITFKKYL